MGLSLVSWIVAMCMLCVCSVCLSSFILLPIPSMFICRSLSVLMEEGRPGVDGVGRAELGGFVGCEGVDG